METVGNSLMQLTPEAAIVVVLAQSLVLFIFSSQGLSDALQSIGLPAIPLVPVSSSQVVIGSIIGIGIYKGGKQIKYNILGSISLGWISTPIVAGIIAFFMLFFVNNVFKQDVGGDRQLINITEVTWADTLAEGATNVNDSQIISIIQDTVMIETADAKKYKIDDTVKSGDVKSFRDYYLIAIVVLFTGLLVMLYLLLRNKKKVQQLITQQKAIKKSNQKKVECVEKSLKDKIHRQNDLGKELKFRQGEMVTMAMSIIHKNEFLNDLKKEVVNIKYGVKDQETRLGLNKLSLMITRDLSIDRDREKFQMHINQQNSNFIHLLSQSFPTMTANEKRLASMLRLNLSSKEIASILNISPKSVEMNRYRLRKKLKVTPKINLNDFIRDL